MEKELEFEGQKRKQWVICRYSSETSYVPGTAVAAGDTAEEETERVLCLLG